MTFYIKQNDTSPSIGATLKDGESNVIDLTDANVKFHMRPVGGSTVAVDRAAVILSPTEGTVRYEWLDGDTVATGVYQAEFEVTYVNGTIETFPNDGYITVQVLPELS